VVLFRFLFAPVLLAVAVLTGAHDRPAPAAQPAAAAPATLRAEAVAPRATPPPVR
jgi:hypothetical protein